MKKKILTYLLVGLMMTTAAFGTVVIHSEADRGGQTRYSAFKKVTFWVSSAAGLDATVSATTEPIYGFVDRVVISVGSSAATDESFEVSLSDENSYTFFSTSTVDTLTTTSQPYSYAITDKDLTSASWPGLAIGGNLTFSIASGDGLDSASVIVYYRDFWK